MKLIGCILVFALLAFSLPSAWASSDATAQSTQGANWNAPVQQDKPMHQQECVQPQFLRLGVHLLFVIKSTFITIKKHIH